MSLENIEETINSVGALAGPDQIFFEPLWQKALSLYSVAASPRSKKMLYQAFLSRQKSLGLANFSDYAAFLRRHQEEWREIWPLALPSAEKLFYPPHQFDIAREVINEWAALASDRRLNILSLGTGGGFEAVSLAIMVEESGLRAKGWQVEIYALDLNGRAIENARRGLFSDDDLGWLSETQKRKWFSPQAGAWAFKSHLAAPITYYEGNAFEPESWPFQELSGQFQVIFCRGLSWEAPERAYKKMAPILRESLAETGFIFLAPGELLPDSTGELYLEERFGLLWYRRGQRRVKINKGHVSKKERAGKTVAKGLSVTRVLPLGLREAHLLKLAQEKLAENLSDEARDLINEVLAASLGAEHLGLLAWPTLALIEKSQGRNTLARLITETAQAFGLED